eukprot:1137802-Pelagomonas_calceolata.AAC.1
MVISECWQESDPGPVLTRGPVVTAPESQHRPSLEGRKEWGQGDARCGFTGTDTTTNERADFAHNLAEQELAHVFLRGISMGVSPPLSPLPGKHGQ